MLGGLAARRDARQRRRAATSACSAPTRPPPTACGAVFEATDRAWEAERLPERRPPGHRRAGDGGAQRAPVPGVARGLPAHRPPRAVQLLRGVHPHRGLDVQPARQVAEGDARASRGAGRSRRSTTCSPRTSGARTTTASRTRTPASSTTWSTRRPRSCACTCRPTPTCLLSVADHCLRSRDYVNVIVAGKQPAPQWLTMDEAVRALHARHRHLGVGEHRRGATPRRRAGVRRRRARRSRRSPPPTCCASTCRGLRVRLVNVVDLMRLRARRAEHPHGLSDAEFDALFTRRPARDLRLPRLPVAHPPAHLPAHQPRATSTCAATWRRGPPRRPSTC